MKHLLMTVSTAAILAVSLPAVAKDVNKASVQGLESGGLSGGIGCLYVTTDEGLFTLPFDAEPNTPQLTAVINIATHPTISFNLGAPSGACKNAPAAPTILLPSTP